MKHVERDPISASLLTARRRLGIDRLIKGGSIWALVLVSLLCLLGVARFLNGAPPLSFELFVVSIGGLVLGAALIGGFSRGTEVEAARLLDARGSTADRFTTALALRNRQHPFAGSADREIRHFVRDVSVRELIPIVLPRTVLWLAAPIFIVTTLSLMSEWRLASTADQRGAASATLEQAVNIVELAEPSDPSIAENLRLSAERLRRESNPDPDETMVRSLAKATEAIRKLAAEANFEARAIPATGSDANGPDGSGMQNSDELLDSAADHAEARTLAEADSEAARRNATERAIRLSNAAFRLDSLRRSEGMDSRDQPQRGPANGRTEEMLAALKGDSDPGDQPSMAGDAESDSPGGPGAEMDRGTAELSGPGLPEIPVTGPEEAARLDAIDGASVAASVISTDGASRSGVAYRTAYDAALPDASSAIQSEFLPVGSRTIVRRYFESIRPD